MNTEITTYKQQDLVPTSSPAPNIASLLQGVISQGVTQENVQALDKLCDLYERMEAKNAEREFNQAFVQMQSEIPVIVATSVIPNRGKYERYEDIIRVVGPIMSKYGFAVSYDQKADDKRITVTCHLRHVSGYSVANPFSVRLGGRADSETQADCKASTTAKRNALLQALNIVIRQDIYQSDEADASIEGGTITPAQAGHLIAECEVLKVDTEKFLAFAGATSFYGISTSRYDDLIAKLNSKKSK